MTIIVIIDIISSIKELVVVVVSLIDVGQHVLSI